MVSAVFQGGLDADHREACQVAVLHSVLDTSVDGRNIFLRNAATGNGILECVGCGLALFQGLWVRVVRLDGADNLCELAGTTGLLLVGVFHGLNLLADGLTVCNLRVTDVCLDLELALHAVNQNVEVELAHAADNGLAGLFIQFNGEGWVLSSKLLNGVTQLLLVSLGLRLNGNLDNRIREVHGLEDDLVILVTQGVTGGGLLQANNCVDVAGVCLLNRVLLVGVHLEKFTDALLLALGGVHNLGTRGDLAGVHADEVQLAEERVSCNLEGQRGEGRLHGRLTGELVVLVADLVADNLANVQRVRQEVNNSVQQRLHALVTVSGTAVNRVNLRVDGQLTDAGFELVNGQLLATEVLLHELFVGLSNGLNQLLAVLCSLVLEVLRDLLVGRLSTGLDLAAPGDSLHVQQVNDAVEVILSADRQLHNQRLSAQTVNNGGDGVVEVCAQLVHLVDEADTRDVVLSSLTPHLLGLRLNAFLTVEDGDGTIENTEGTLNLNGEVNVTRGVDDVDLVVVPEAGHGSGGNGDAAFLLLCHPVSGGRTVVGLAHLTVDTGVEENTLGGRRLTSIDVGHDADVTDLVQVLKHFLCHVYTPT